MNALLIVGTMLAWWEQIYPGAGFAGQMIPRFERGYLLFAKRPCQLTVYHPSERLLFSQSLQGPKGAACNAIQATVDSDGSLAVGISYSATEGYAGGIVLLDSTGKQTSVIETKRFMPAHVAFGPDHSIWSIGWQRDAARNEIADHEDYPIVRRFSRSGTQTGAFLPRSLWPGKGEPVILHRFKTMLGADGEELVFSTSNTSAGTAELVWFKPQGE